MTSPAESTVVLLGAVRAHEHVVDHLWFSVVTFISEDQVFVFIFGVGGGITPIIIVSYEFDLGCFGFLDRGFALSAFFAHWLSLVGHRSTSTS